MKNTGFTFIELIIVMSIIITLIGLSIPAVIGYQRRQAESEEVKNFISAFRTTQNLALTTDTSYSFSFAPGNVTICPFNSTECRVLNTSYIVSATPKINIDRYGNLVNDANILIGTPEYSFQTPSYQIKINKVGRIDYVNR